MFDMLDHCKNIYLFNTSRAAGEYKETTVNILHKQRFPAKFIEFLIPYISINREKMYSNKYQHA